MKRPSMAARIALTRRETNDLMGVFVENLDGSAIREPPIRRTAAAMTSLLRKSEPAWESPAARSRPVIDRTVGGPRPWLSFLAIASSRSAAALNAATTAACVACARSTEAIRASFSAASSSSSTRSFVAISDRSSAMVSAAMMVRRASPTSPIRPRRSLISASKSLASFRDAAPGRPRRPCGTGGR